MGAKMTPEQQFDLFHEAYIECALWASEATNLTPNEEFEMMRDCMDFMVRSLHLIQDLDLAQCGHDFWLTRNGHGSGFWDRGYDKALADELTLIAHEFGEYWLELTSMEN